MKKATILGCLVLLAVGGVVVAGRGSGGKGSSLEGVYKFQTGKSTAVLTIKTDNKATYSINEDASALPVTYKVKDGTLALVGATGEELNTGKFKIVDGGLRDFAGNLYKKQ